MKIGKYYIENHICPDCGKDLHVENHGDTIYYACENCDFDGFMKKEVDDLDGKR